MNMRLASRLALTRGNFSLQADLTFDLQGITALFGKTGSGKTTLLRHIAGLDHTPGAHLQLGDNLLQDQKTFVPPHLRGIGYIFQQAELFDQRDVMGNLLFGYNRTPALQRRFSPAEMIDLLNIGHLVNRNATHLSGGEKQLVALARALLASPRILLMDEPLSALDGAAKQVIYPLLRKIAHQMEIPIVYVSHAVDEVAALADAMILLESGRILAAGKIEELLTRLDLPLARQADAEVLILGHVAAHDSEWQLTEIEFTGGRFLAPHVDLPLLSPVRLRVAASDVSLTLSPATASSIINSFTAQVIEVTEVGAIAIVKILVGDASLVARLTRKSCHALGIMPGKQVFAHVKGVAVLV